MQIAIFGDIHGNSIALDAVLDDIKVNGGVDEYWLLGDYCAIGHDPIGCLERLANLPNAEFVRGNTDRYITIDLSLGEDFEEALETPEKALKIAGAHQSFTWTQGAVTASGWLDWLKALPLEMRKTLPDSTEVLMVHASPGSDDSAGLHPKQDEDDLTTLFGQDSAGLIVVGHTHVAMDVRLQEKRLINTSSVSNPFPPDLNANYLILSSNEESYSVERYSVPYDHEAVIEQVQKIQHPAAEYIISFMRGSNIAAWMD